MSMMQVTIPPGVSAGQPFIVQAPDGSQMQVIANGPPGQVMTVQAPAPPVAAVQAVPVGVPGAPMAVPMGAPTGVPMGAAITPQLIGPQDQVPLLDATTMGILANVNSFKVQQRVKFWEAFSGGCCEQSNTYDFFDQATGAHVFIAQEESDSCLRCCCAPTHSVRIEFKLVNASERRWSSRAEIATMATVMTMEREGCCSKPCLGCCICADMCKDGMYLHAGPPPTQPPGTAGVLESTIGYATQPKCGGYFTPTLNLFNRTAFTLDKETAFSPMAKVEGPCLFGGCSELCCDSVFSVSGLSPGTLETKLKTADLAKIVKEKPRGFCACGRELFTDSDHFTVTFRDDIGLTPQQKASMMASMVLSDYMFFEQDIGAFSCEGSKIKINLCNLYCCGHTQPCKIIIDVNQNGGGGGEGGGPENQKIER